MKIRKRNNVIFIVLILILNYCTSIPYVSAPAPPPSPDQFIGEIFPNCTLPLQLSHTNTIITFNAADFPNKIHINFDANYTIYNPENITTIPVILPFSLAINITNFTFDVYTNKTLIPYDLFSISPWIENITEIDIHFAWFIEVHPITLIRSNTTLPKNGTSVIRYHFNGSISNPLDSSDLFYMVYHLGTSQEWIGNTTGRVELRIYGKEPRFSRLGYIFPPCQLVDITGGKSYICEWNNTKSPWVDIGIRFYREASPFVEIMEIIAFSFPIFITITGIIIIGLIKRRERKKKELT